MNYRYAIRDKIKTRFVELHLPLFEEVALIEYQKYKSDVGKKITLLARNKIGYSPKYIDIDLFRSLMKKYENIKKEI